MTDVFISYSRLDSDFTRRLHGRLVEEGRNIWVDWEDIPATADWWDEIQSAIENSDIFAFIISPNSVKSEICYDEIQHAIDNNKRFVPLLYLPIEDVDAPHIHPAIRSHNWIDFQDEAKFDDAVAKLLASLATEPEYLRRHTRLLVNAKDWEANNRNPSYLLTGAELSEYQAWLEQSHTLTPKPTELQYDYMLASQSARTRQRLQLAGAFVVAMIVILAFGVFALFQQEQLEESNAQGTIEAQQIAILAGTSQARGTQIAVQQTNIAGVRVDATNIIVQANAQNTQAALQSQINTLIETVSAFETQNVVINAPTLTATTDIVASAADEEDASMGSIAVAVALTQTAIPTQVVVVPTQIPLATSIPDASDTIAYTVQDGDFAVDIAERFGTTVREISDLNDINPSFIYVGQVLQIPYSIDVNTDSELFVASTGDDNNDCLTRETACLTINGALARAGTFPRINIASGVYQEEFDFNQDVALFGNGTENTILSGDFNSNVVTIEPENNVYIVGMTITGGSATWGSGIINYGNLTLINTRVSSNYSELAAGGIANFGVLTARYTEFVDNYAPYYSDIYNWGNAEFITEDEVLYTEERLFDDFASIDGTPLDVGVLVTVTTTEGDTLRLRPEPNTDQAPLDNLIAGTPLLIIGEPVESGGFRWWNVQTASGLIGWVADFDEEPTIRPLDNDL